MKRSARIMLFMAALSISASAQVLRYAELNTRQIEDLNRNKSVIVIPSAPLEEHGPYLPSYADGYWAERHAQELAEAIASRPGWTAVLLPAIPLSCHGAEAIGLRYNTAGSLTPRCNTVRQVFMDLADALGGQRFKWVFLVNYHGGPNNNLALDQAGEYFHDTYGGEMVHLFGLMPVRFCCDLREKFLTPEQLKADAFTVHADAEETSMMLALQPTLVAPDFKSAPDQTGKDFADLMKIATHKDWPGYFGSPRAASAALGLAEHQAMVKASVEMTWKILDGFDYRKLPNYAAEMSKDASIPRVLAGEHDQRQAARQSGWLKKKGY
jgi:creatinine amidohydrolase